MFAGRADLTLHVGSLGPDGRLKFLAAPTSRSTFVGHRGICSKRPLTTAPNSAANCLQA